MCTLMTAEIANTVVLAPSIGLAVGARHLPTVAPSGRTRELQGA
jgi:hypothetical protein